ncbi:MAG TPA: hypothetical protein VHI52_18835 [Verrucomicrobiae bacterium]|nr:hypothetical protein [Verrucomicrobiae bacterium]HWB08270.1 hypothetical protein [Pirellulales bacterium]
MEQNPYKAPAEGASSQRPKPRNVALWVVTLAIGAFFWIGSTFVMMAAVLGIDPPRPEHFMVAWGWMATEWIVGGAFTLLAAIKLRRRNAA